MFMVMKMRSRSKKEDLTVEEAIKAKVEMQTVPADIRTMNRKQSILRLKIFSFNAKPQEENK